MRRVCAVALLAAIGSVSNATAGSEQRVAMVTDLVGRGSASFDGEPRPLVFLAVLPVGAEISLEIGARLALVYLDTGLEYSLGGPSRAQVGANALTSLEGTTPAERAVLRDRNGKVVRIRPIDVASAAVVLREVPPAGVPEPLTPCATRVLDSRLVFRWSAASQGAEPARSGYRFELLAENRQALYEAEVEQEELRLPDGVSLQGGQSYRWSVASRGAIEGSRGCTFALLDEAERDRLETLRPEPDAPFSDRVLFATLLRELQIHDEARRHWAELAKERPELRALEDLAR